MWANGVRLPEPPEWIIVGRLPRFLRFSKSPVMRRIRHGHFEAIQRSGRRFSFGVTRQALESRYPVKDRVVNPVHLGEADGLTLLS